MTNTNNDDDNNNNSNARNSANNVSREIERNPEDITPSQGRRHLYVRDYILHFFQQGFLIKGLLLG